MGVAIPKAQGQAIKRVDKPINKASNDPTWGHQTKKVIKLTLDTAGQAALAQLIADKLSAEVGGPVTVELKKPPKGKGSVKKDGAKSKFSFSAVIPSKS